MITGLGFKLAVVRFISGRRMCMRDPAVTAFVATVSRARLSRCCAVLVRSTIVPVKLLTLSLIAIASMFVGNLLACYQKTSSAYWPIQPSHFGYIVVAFVASGNWRRGDHLLCRRLCCDGARAFGVVTVLSRERGCRYVGRLSRLFWRRHGRCFYSHAAVAAGIPMTAGLSASFSSSRLAAVGRGADHPAGGQQRDQPVLLFRIIYHDRRSPITGVRPRIRPGPILGRSGASGSAHGPARVARPLSTGVHCSHSTHIRRDDGIVTFPGQP